ncbi:hypothetical protein PRIPAC_76383, partial [Pristionchus pacificus]|uniref:Uncharacterized protein n=1 Tax=Pristionchus pacificus TaxID=54126 RepID=A0A2A6BEG2_PRIPA
LSRTSDSPRNNVKWRELDDKSWEKKEKKRAFTQIFILREYPIRGNEERNVGWDWMDVPRAVSLFLKSEGPSAKKWKFKMSFLLVVSSIILYTLHAAWVARQFYRALDVAYIRASDYRCGAVAQWLCARNAIRKVTSSTPPALRSTQTKGVKK